MNLIQKRMDLQVDIDGDGLAVSFKPNAARTIAVLPPNTGISITSPNGVTFIADTTSSSPGDELVLVTEQASSVQFFFQTVNGINLLSCGTADQGGEGGFAGGHFQPDPKWIGHFWFDGTVFTNSYDNC